MDLEQQKVSLKKEMLRSLESAVAQLDKLLVPTSSFFNEFLLLQSRLSRLQSKIRQGVV